MQKKAGCIRDPLIDLVDLEGGDSQEVESVELNAKVLKLAVSTDNVS